MGWAVTLAAVTAVTAVARASHARRALRVAPRVAQWLRLGQQK
jgi:hypothetical protein